MAYGLPDLAVTGDLIPAAWGNAVRNSLAATAVGIVTTVGDLVYASGANALARLAAVASGQVLKSAGVGVAPAYGALAASDLPAVPYCRADRASTNQTIASGSITLLTWERAAAGQSSWWAGANPGRVTVPADGKYLVHVYVRWASTAPARSAFLRYSVGSTLQVEGNTATNTSIYQLLPPVIVEMVAGSYVYVEVLQSSGAPVDIVAGGSYLEVIFLGR